MIIIFTGPPFAGKDTQAKRVSKALQLPVFSMGHIIRDAYAAGNQKAVEGFENYSMKGLHVPNDLKFGLLKEKLDQHPDGYILDNYPATQEDLDTYLSYLTAVNKTVDCVIYMNITKEEMLQRMTSRDRADDTIEIVMKRRENQDKDREAVISYFSAKGMLEEINGHGDVEAIHSEIMERIQKYDTHSN